MIPLYVFNGKACIWNAKDWRDIREKYRIMGEFIGTLASHPRQNNFLGFPVMLMTEEVRLLIDKGICELLQHNDISKHPIENFKKLAEDTENRLLCEQSEYEKMKKKEEISLRINVITAGKQKKLAKQGKSIDINKEELLNEELEKFKPLTKENSLIQIAVEHPWPSKYDKVSINELILDVNSDINYIRYEIFKDLWEKGYYITSGTKFGGDFLVYLGDPVKFHAISIIKCMKDRRQEMSVSDIVAFGRLGVAVNKLTVYAYLTDENIVKYQTLQWFDVL